MGEWRNWQTRRIQVPVIARSWGFKSPLAHKVILDPPRPRRRVMSRFIWPLAITVAVVVAFAVSGAGRDTRAELEYLDRIHGHATTLSIGGDGLRGVVARLSLVDRIEFVTAIDSLQEDIELGLETIELGPPSDTLVAVNVLYRQALQTWSAGLRGFRSGVLTAADDRSDRLVVDDIVDALAEMRAGDELYRALVAELGEEDVPGPMAPMPEVVIMPGEGGLAGLAGFYVASARVPSNFLNLRAGLAVSQIAFEPELLIDPSGQAVLPATDDVVFSVVISNAGNVASFPETLTLTLTGGPEDIELFSDLEILQPSEQTTVRFDPIAVESGLVYEVVAELSITDTDSSFEDNRIEVVFVVKEGGSVE